MVRGNFYINQFGTVAIFATLFAAIHVNGDRGCVFDFEHTSDFDFQCGNARTSESSWTVSEDGKDSLQKKVLTLRPDEDGCLKTKSSITLNSTTPVHFKFYRSSGKDEGKFVLRLIPKDGSCPDDECVWNIAADPQCKPGEWVSAEYKFPLKSMREYYVQIESGKSKGKFLLDRITFPTARGDSSRCHMDSGSLKAAEETVMNGIQLPNQMIDSSGGTVRADPPPADAKKPDAKAQSPSLAEFSKNLMLTSASVLTLNNLLN